MITVSSAESNMAGSRRVLICNIVLPTGVTISDLPSLQWRRPSGGSATGKFVSGDGSVYINQLILNPLTLSDGGDYTCTATYSLGGQTSPSVMRVFSFSVVSKFSNSIITYYDDYNNQLNYVCTVPEPSVTLQVRDTTDAKILVGENITLTCDIQLREVLIVNVNVSMMVEWHRDGSRLSDSTRISITTTTAGLHEVQSRLSFRPVVFSDSGRYNCTAILTSLQGTSSSVSTSQDRQLTVQSMLVVYRCTHNKYSAMHY